MTCRTGCPTQDHDSYSACLKAANVRVGWSNSAKGLDLTVTKKNERRLARYEQARREGMQPDTTKAEDIQKAIEISDKTGEAYRA